MADLLEQLDNVDWDGEGDAIQEYMRTEVYPLLFGAAYDEAGGQLPVDVAFDVTNPAIEKAIDQMGTRIKGVADTTRDNVRSIVSEALKGEYDEGAGRVVVPSNKEIATRIREQGDIDKAWRSEMIARTETATGMNLGSTYAYEDAGVSQVEVLDGDDDEACASANGATWSLADARDNPLGHPNCTRAFAPVVE